MARAIPLSQGAKIFRSKNAGPFRTTVDIFYSDPDIYYHIKQSGNLTPSLVAQTLKRPKEAVEGIFFSDQALGIKITLAKCDGMASGEPTCADTLGAQQYIPLKDLVIDIAK